jgi:hypothetical protein
MEQDQSTIRQKLGKVRWGAFIIEKESDGSYKMSIGRLMCWITFALLCYMWLSGKSTPESLITTFYVLISYNLVKKLPMVGEEGATMVEKMDMSISLPGKDGHHE